MSSDRSTLDPLRRSRSHATRSEPPSVSGRFQRISRIGEGGMGAVYHAVDRWRGTRVALKSVGRCEGDRLLRFKREFRLLCDVDHPNLVRLGELFEEDGEWFFTMELVDGVHFLDHVRAQAPVAPDERPTNATSDRTLSAVADPRLGAHPLATAELPFDEVRLRHALAQLVEAVATLHDLDKVHRDIKPSNVLVTPDGRVVLIDFGLVTELREGLQATDVGFAGTVAYMSPEQAEGRPVDASADWYAVGVVLFEALTGRLPFEGPQLRVLGLKVSNDAPRPSSLQPGIPTDLDDLCVALLARDPAERPKQAEIFRRLFLEERGAGARTSSSRRPGSAPNRAFVGRERELAALGELAATVLAGEPASVLVYGESGIGKSALVDRFVDALEQGDSRWLVLRGRGAPRESVPFHAVDEIIDALTGYLAKRPRDEVAALTPAHVPLLARTFPVLRRIEPFGRDVRAEAIAPQEQRARVFGALRELLRRIAAGRALLVVVDDLQWVDADSAALLAELLRQPDAPTMLFLGTVRTAGVDAEPDLPTVLDELPFGVIALGRLTADESRALRDELRIGDATAGATADDALLEAADGHPLFLAEMLLDRLERPNSTDEPLDLGRTLVRRYEAVPESGRSILRTLAVADHAVPIEVLIEVTGLEPNEIERQAARLRIERLVRLGTHASRTAYEAYHGLIRDAVLSTLPTDRRRDKHGRIARVYEAIGLGTPDLLAIHFREAGDLASASRYAEIAARRAAEALAFDHAASLYRTVLGWESEAGRERPELRIAYAEALAHAGRGEESADAFLDASHRSVALEALDLRRRAGEQLMLSGRFDRGIALFEELLGVLGERYHRSAFLTIVSLIWSRIRRALRGDRFVERHASELVPELRLRHDVVVSLAVGLIPVDSIRGASFISRAHLLALELGEPGRVARLLTYSVADTVVTSARSVRAAHAILDRAAALAERSDDPTPRALVVYCQGLVANLVGDWRSTLDPLLQADRLFREECRTPPPEFRTLQTLIPFVYFELGRFRDLRARASRTLREAEELGDLMIRVNVHCMAGQLLGCIDDAPAVAHTAASEAMASWPLRGSNQDASYMEGSVACALYEGRTEEALAILDRSWPILRSAMVFFVHLMRVRAYRARCLVLLHHAARVPDPGREQRLAAKDIRRIRREGTEWTDAVADQMEASLRALRGDVRGAVDLFARAAHAYERLGMEGYRHGCLRRKGELTGDAGRSLVASSDAFLVEQGVVDPARMYDVLVPPSGRRAVIGPPAASRPAG